MGMKIQQLNLGGQYKFQPVKLVKNYIVHTRAKSESTIPNHKENFSNNLKELICHHRAIFCTQSSQN
jgi:hypothetical protein